MTVKIGRRVEKRWGALFTCLTTRAIHIELVNTLTTDSTIMALKRFISRRGSPQIIYSDNATNFKGASKELKDAVHSLDKNEFNIFSRQRKIEWKFNPPCAPNMGGAWERLIRSVKNAMTVVLKNQNPKEEVLLTTLIEIEHAINSRPLTHVSVDPRDQEALTPNHFLLGSSSGEIRFGRHDAQYKCTSKQWRISQNFADSIWKRWLREYLPTLIARKKWQVDEEPLEVGNLVLILDQNAPRNEWKKGIIFQIFPATDSQVRLARVKTAYGPFTRPTRKLIKFSCVQKSS